MLVSLHVAGTPAVGRVPVRLANAARRMQPTRGPLSLSPVAAVALPLRLRCRPPPPAAAARPPPPAPRPPVPPAPTPTAPAGRATFVLIALNLLVFAASKLGAPWVSALALHYARPRAWQLVTCAFVHLDAAHLSSNLFSLLIFGKSVEEREGAVGVVVTYLVTALCSSLAALAFLPRTSVSVGASGAVFGLIAVAALVRLKWTPQSLVEAGILGSYAAQQVLHEARAQAAGGAIASGGAAVSHVAHLAGAAAGVLLVAVLSRLGE